MVRFWKDTKINWYLDRSFSTTFSEWPVNLGVVVIRYKIVVLHQVIYGPIREWFQGFLSARDLCTPLHSACLGVNINILNGCYCVQLSVCPTKAKGWKGVIQVHLYFYIPVEILRSLILHVALYFNFLCYVRFCVPRNCQFFHQFGTLVSG